MIFENKYEKKNYQKNEYGFETNDSKSKLENFLIWKINSKKKKSMRTEKRMFALPEINPRNERGRRYL